MRRHVWKFSTVLAVLAVTACAQRSTMAVGQVDPKDPVVLRLERGPCRGFCPVYVVEVTERGRVRFDGQRFVKDSGQRNHSVSADAVRDLMVRVAATRFAATDTAITPEHMRCGRYMADLPSAAVSARLNGGLRTVRFDRGCEGAPRFLDSLATAVDSLARTAPWVIRKGGNTP
jgi:hypothetical protein